MQLIAVLLLLAVGMPVAEAPEALTSVLEKVHVISTNSEFRVPPRNDSQLPHCIASPLAGSISWDEATQLASLSVRLSEAGGPFWYAHAGRVILKSADGTREVVRDLPPDWLQLQLAGPLTIASDDDGSSLGVLHGRGELLVGGQRLEVAGDVKIFRQRAQEDAQLAVSVDVRDVHPDRRADWVGRLGAEIEPLPPASR